jgi:hypothetical protein
MAKLPHRKNRAEAAARYILEVAVKQLKIVPGQYVPRRSWLANPGGFSSTELEDGGRVAVSKGWFERNEKGDLLLLLAGAHQATTGGDRLE